MALMSPWPATTPSLLSADKSRIIATRFGLVFFLHELQHTSRYIRLNNFLSRLRWIARVYFFHFSGQKSSQKFLFFLPRDSWRFRGFHLLTLTWFSISHWFRGASCTSKAPNNSQISSIFFTRPNLMTKRICKDFLTLRQIWQLIRHLGRL